VGSVAIVVFVKVILRDSLAPRCTSFELLVVNIDTSIDDVDINTLATIGVIFVLAECAEGEFGAMADACETLKKRLRVDESHSRRNERIANEPREQLSGHPGF
jgi:hypothetical protein